MQLLSPSILYPLHLMSQRYNLPFPRNFPLLHALRYVTTTTLFANFHPVTNTQKTDRMVTFPNLMIKIPITHLITFLLTPYISKAPNSVHD